MHFNPATVAVALLPLLGHAAKYDASDLSMVVYTDTRCKDDAQPVDLADPFTNLTLPTTDETYGSVKIAGAYAQASLFAFTRSDTAQLRYMRGEAVYTEPDPANALHMLCPSSFGLTPNYFENGNLSPQILAVAYDPVGDSYCLENNAGLADLGAGAEFAWFVATRDCGSLAAADPHLCIKEIGPAGCAYG